MYPSCLPECEGYFCHELKSFFLFLCQFFHFFVTLRHDMNINGMEQLIEIPKTQVIMAFVATCVEATARLLGTTYLNVYQRMKRIGMIERYIIPHYETLHIESRENIVNGMIEYLNQWEDSK